MFYGISSPNSKKKHIRFAWAIAAVICLAGGLSIAAIREQGWSAVFSVGAKTTEKTPTTRTAIQPRNSLKALSSAPMMGTLGGTFELDGNATESAATPGEDWNQLFPTATSTTPIATIFAADPVVNGSDSTTFTGGGSKDDLNIGSWRHEPGTSQDKAEITNAYAALYKDPDNGDQYLYFGADRFSNDGDTTMGFWFFQNPVTRNADGTFSGTHTIGDLLIVSDFSKGGGTSSVIVYRWVGSGGSDGSLNKITPGANAFAIANSTAQTSPWPYTPKANVGPAGTFQKGCFFEGGINLSQVLPNAGNTCFSSFLAETRASTSVQSTLSDFVLGSFETCKLEITSGVGGADVCAQNATVNIPLTVTNSGIASLTVNVTDDNGTPANTADDIDIDGSPTGVVIAPATSKNFNHSFTPTSTTTHTIKTVGTNGTTTVIDTLEFTATVSTCAIGLTKAPSVSSLCGSGQVTYTYTVTNTGNKFKTDGSITDDNGTPGNTGDDVAIGTFTNLMPGASAQFTYTTTLSGTRTNIATASGTTGPTGQSVQVSAMANATVTVTPTATVNAGDDQTVCATNPKVTLAGSVGGSATGGTWSGGTGTFNPNANTLTAMYTPSAAEIAAGMVTLTLTTTGGCNVAEDSVKITITPAATANAGDDVTVCAVSPKVTLAGSVGGSATGGTWSGGTGTFDPGANALNAMYTPSAAEIAAGMVTLTLTTTGGCNVAEDSVKITITPAATANAGQDQTVCAATPKVTLAGVVGGSATGGTWSGGTGTFDPGANSLTAMYTPSAAEIAAGMVTLTLTTTGGCNVAEDSVKIAITPAATVNAGSDQTVCSSDPMVLLAGVVGGSATGGTWSGGTGTFDPNANALNAKYLPSAAEIAAGMVTLTLTTTGGCNVVEDSVKITINPAATVDAGDNQTICAANPIVMLAGVVGGGATTGTWSGGAGVFDPSPGTLNAKYTPSAAEIAAGMVTLTLTTDDPAGPCGAVSDTVKIALTAAATANAGDDQTICAATPKVTLAGSVGGSATGGTWSGGTGTFNPNANTLTAMYTPSAAEIAAGMVTLTLTTTGGCNVAEDSVKITITPAATANAGDDVTVCAVSPKVTLAGSVGGSATGGTWSGGTGTFDPNASTLTAMYTPSAAEIAAGMVTLKLTTTGGCNVAEDSVKITINPVATVNAGEDQTVCEGGSVKLNGKVGGGATGGTWSIVSGAGTFDPNATTLDATFTPTGTGKVVLKLTTNDPDGPCGAVEDTVEITVNPGATVNAGTDLAVCEGGSVKLDGKVGGGATGGTWSIVSGDGTFSPNATTLNATFTPTGTGEMVLKLTTNDPDGPCPAAEDTVKVTVNPLPKVKAGPDDAQLNCKTKEVKLSSDVTNSSPGDMFVFNWVASNGGHIKSGADTNMPVVDASGTYTVTVTNQKTGCVSASALVKVTEDITPPDANAGADKTIDCATGSVKLLGTSSTSGATASWTGPDGFTSTEFQPTVTKPGTYTLKVTGSNGCTAEDTVVVSPCVASFCSLTQGAYGNANGKFNGENRLTLLGRLIGAPGPYGSLTIGKTGALGRSLTFVDGSESCIIQRMPAGRTPNAFPSGMGNLIVGSDCGILPSLLFNGRFNSVLIGQTLTLSLNVRLDPDLGDLAFCNTMVTRKALPGPDGLIGTQDDIPDPNPGLDGILNTADDTLTVTIPGSVRIALTSLGLPQTVNGILELANRALAGQDTKGATFSDINAAADAINRGFDECRFLVKCQN